MRDANARPGWIGRGFLWSGLVLVGVALPLVLAMIMVERTLVPPTPQEIMAEKTPLTAAEIQAAFDRVGYSVRDLRGNAASVPDVFLKSLPPELPRITNASQRKALFLSTLLPLVLKVNDGIRQERERLLAIRAEVEAGRKLSSSDRKWLKALQKEYRVKTRDFDKLERRVNVVPPSLALAQAAIESGWGTSRFAQKGNALFGQWTWKGEGIVPRDRKEGATHKVKSFDRLIESVDGYVWNLNTHPAYRTLRKKRAALIRNGEALTGLALTPALIKYSERREAYVQDLRNIIISNRLTRFDSSRIAARADISRAPAS